MAQKQNTKSSNSVCKKFCNAVSVCPIKAKIRRISHQFSTIDDPKLRLQNSKPNPVQVVQQPSFSIKIPIESEPSAAYVSAQNNKSHAELGKREIVIINGDNGKKVASRKVVNYGDQTDDKFSEYISKVKKRMLKTVSSLGGGGGRSETKKDSFNDKVTNYIDHTKMKIRTTTTIGDHRSISLK